MQDALEKDSRVHRDISAGNIILVRDGADPNIRKGYLIDWESSCTVEDSGLATKAGRAVRGTSRNDADAPRTPR